MYVRPGVKILTMTLAQVSLKVLRLLCQHQMVGRELHSL